jgi:RimJ/RimL family protein N-acetyltransferase
MEGVVQVGVARDPDGYLSASWWVHPDFRRRGLAIIAVEILLRKQPEPVRALIRPSNVASLRLARRLGFRVVSEDEENVLMEWSGSDG